MQKMQEIRNRSAKEYQNRGFTLVEVIIAVVIMTIAAIPILHAFSTSAQTSSKALIKMRATNAAENIMEDIKGLTLEQIVDKYGDDSVTYPNYDGMNPADPAADPTIGYTPRKDKEGNVIKAGYEFELNASSADYNDDINNVLDKGYTAKIQIDPTYYPNINTVNMSDFDEVDVAHSAILSVSSKMDTDALNKYSELSAKLATDHPYYMKSPAERIEAFSKVYKREIRIDVKDMGTDSDDEGNEVQLAEITATVSYLLPGNNNEPGGKYVPLNTSTQRIIDRQKIFTNVNNKNKLNSVFILYDPIFENAEAPSEYRDFIIVHNTQSVPFNLYVVAQGGAANEHWDDYRKQSIEGCLVLQIYQNKKDDGSVTLYTNLHEDVEYSRKTTSETIPVQCFINLADRIQDPEGVNDKFTDTMYTKLKNKKGSWESKESTRLLGARDIDGKYLDASLVDDKIYDVRVTVTKDYDEDAGDWPISVTLTGTITE